MNVINIEIRAERFKGVAGRMTIQEFDMIHHFCFSLHMLLSNGGMAYHD